jgi:hypothetical protein
MNARARLAKLEKAIKPRAADNPALMSPTEILAKIDAELAAGVTLPIEYRRSYTALKAALSSMCGGLPA